MLIKHHQKPIIMRNLKICLGIFASALILACNNNKVANVSDTTANTADSNLTKIENAEKVDTMAITFFKNAAYGGMIEVETSNKMIQSTKNAQIKAFAEMMVKDHGEANQKVKALAQSKGFMPPTILPEDKLMLVQKLDSYKDESKNEYYAQLMIQEHKNAIQLFTEAGRSDDTDIANLATATLPTLNAHYKQITKIDSLLKTRKLNQGDDPIGISNRKN